MPKEQVVGALKMAATIGFFYFNDFPHDSCWNLIKERNQIVRQGKLWFSMSSICRWYLMSSLFWFSSFYIHQLLSSGSVNYSEVAYYRRTGLSMTWGNLWMTGSVVKQGWRWRNLWRNNSQTHFSVLVLLPKATTYWTWSLKTYF